MKYLFFIVLLLCGFISNAQVYQEMPQYGYRANRMSFDSTLQIPTTCGVPTLKSVVNVSKKAAIAFDSCNKRFYYYNPKFQQWDTIKGGSTIDTASLSNRINLKLNITDTANKWVNYIYRKVGQDSIFFRIGSTEYAIKDSIGSGSGSSGGGLSYYLNGGTASDVATYYEMSYNASIGSGVDFTKSGNGLISQWLSDAGNPNKTEIPAGNWNLELYFSASSLGGNPKYYVELLKYNGSTFTSIASNSSVPEAITGGTSIDLYLSSLSIPTTTLLATDRLALRVYITNNVVGRTITMHTQDSHLCQVITNFSAIDSLIYQTNYRADTSRSNIYNALNGKLNTTDTASLSSRINSIDLQFITDNGDATTNDIRVNSLYLYDDSNDSYSHLSFSNNIFSVKNLDGNDLIRAENGAFALNNGFNTYSQINNYNTSTNRAYGLPDTSGTFAMRGDSTIFDTKYRTDTARTNIYSAINTKLNKSDSTIYQTKYRSDTSRTNIYNALNGKQSSLTFSTGLTNTSGTITNNLSVGVSGGQSIIGGTASGNSLTLSSTSNATKGKLLFGTSAYDEVNNRLGVGTASPTNTMDIIRGTAGGMARSLYESASFSYSGDNKFGLYTNTAFNSGNASIVFGNSGTTNATGHYPGFEFQYVPQSTVANNYMTLNYLNRDVAGTVISASTGLMSLYQDGRVIFNGAGLSSSTKVLIGTATDAGYKIDINGTARAVTSLQTPILRGNTTSAGTLTLQSTNNATKGKILFGTSAYDEVNNRLGIGTASPATTFDVNSLFQVASTGAITLAATNTAAGTTGNQTINKASGTLNIAAGGITITCTNSLVTTSSIVFAVVRNNDATAVIKNVVPGAGSFVINLNAATTAETSIGFFVIN